MTRLRDLGYPVAAMAGPGGGYGFGRGGRLPPLVLEEDEAVATAIGLRLAARTSVTGAEDAAAGASAKLEHLLSATAAARVDAVAGALLVLDAAREALDADLLGRIAAAAIGRQQLRLRYLNRDGVASTGLIGPYLPAGRHAGALVPGRPRPLAGGVADVSRRPGRGHRDHRARRGHPRPSRCAGPGGSLGVDLDVPIQARVRIDAPAELVAGRIPADVGLVEADADGCILTTGADDLDVLTGHLVMLGLPFSVLDPPALVAHVRMLADRLRARPAPR